MKIFKFKELKWQNVYGRTGVGGSLLGCQRIEAKEVGLDKIAQQFKKHNIHGLLIIGGFESYKSVIQLTAARDKYSEFRIPLVHFLPFNFILFFLLLFYTFTGLRSSYYFKQCTWY